MPGAQDVIGLLFRIDADSKPAQADIEKLRTTLGGEVSNIQGIFNRLGVSLPTGLFAEISRVTNVAKQDFSNMAQGATGAGGALAGLVGPATLALTVTVALTAGLVGLALGIFNIAKESAEAGAHLYDLSLKTGFTVETLSALSIAASKGGSDIDSVSQALVKFTNNLAAAADGDKKMADVFRRLGIDVQEGVKDPEKALAQFLQKFAELPTEAERVIYASDVFGQRVGASLNGTFQEVGGNLDQFKAKLKEMGVLISTDSAKKADELDDLLAELGHQFDGLKRQLAEQFMPIIVDALRSFSHWLRDNKSAINQWVDKIKDALWWANAFASFMRWAVDGETADQQARQIMDAKGMPHDEKGMGTLRMTPEMEQQARDFADKTGDTVTLNDGETYKGQPNGGQDPGLPTSGDAAEKADAAREKDLQADQKSAEIRLQIAQRLYQKITEAAERSYKQQRLSLDDLVEREKEAEEDLYKAKLRTINAERQQVEQSNKLRPKEKQARNDELDEKAAQALADKTRNLQRIQDDADQKAIESKQRQLQTLEQIAQVSDAAQIASERDRIRQRAVTEQEGEDFILGIELLAMKRRREALDEESRHVGEDKQKHEELELQFRKYRLEREAFDAEAFRRLEAARQRDEANERDHLKRMSALRRAAAEDRAELDRINLERVERFTLDTYTAITERARLELDAEDRRHAKAQEDLDEQERQALEEETNQEHRLEIETLYHERREAEAERHRDRLREISEGEQSALENDDPSSWRSIFGDEIVDKINNTESALIRFGTVAGTVLGQLSKNAGNMGTILSGAFNALAQGMGRVIQNWVLLGEFSGKAIRKMVAEVLAGVAAQAAVKAIFEVAEGLAALARYDPWAASNHFAAAKIYGVVAGVAAVAGRVVAGNAFKDDARNDQGTPTGSRLATADRSGSTSGGSGSSTGTGTGSDTVEVIERERRQVEIVVRHEPGTVVDIVHNDFTNNGKTRVMVEEGR